MENAIVADLDEIVFRSRNKEYGAYVLRKKYPRSTTVAFGIGVGFLIFAFFLPSIIQYIQTATAGNEIEIKETEAKLEAPPPIDEDKQPEELKVEPPPPPQRSEVKFVPPEIVEHEEAPPEKTIASVDTLKKEADIGGKDVQGDADAPPAIGDVGEGGTGNKPVEIAAAPEKDPEPDEFVYAEKQPEPVNMDEIKKKIEYPHICKEANIQGKVFIKILVDKEGKPVKHKVLRSPHDLLTQACVKEIYNLKFTPAIQAGKPIKVWVSVPFDFKLR